MYMVHESWKTAAMDIDSVRHWDGVIDCGGNATRLAHRHCIEQVDNIDTGSSWMDARRHAEVTW
jgi:hypothetical protein